MNRLLLSLVAALALAGCAGMNQRSYGTWLDHVGEPPRNLVPLAPADKVALQKEATQLRGEAGGLRARLAAEPDRVRRIELLGEIQVVGDRLRDVETVLRQGGRNPSFADRLPGAV